MKERKGGEGGRKKRWRREKERGGKRRWRGKRRGCAFEFQETSKKLEGEKEKKLNKLSRVLVSLMDL